MNLTSLPKINFYRNTPIPTSKPNSTKKRGGIGGNFYSIDPDLVNQQRGSIKGGIKSGAKGAAYGAGLTAGAMENAVKGMVAAIFRKQNQRNRQKYNAAAARSSSQADSVSTLAPLINANTLAMNRLGATTNSIASNLGQVLKIEQARFKQEKLERRRSFKPTYTKREPVKFGLGGLGAALFSKMGGFWNAISGLIGGLLKYLFIRGILEWMANPRNKQKIVTILETGKKVVTFLYNFTKGRVAGIIDGLAKAFDGDKSLKERMGGALGALTNLGLLLLGIRWLSNPTKIIKDVGFVLGRFKSALTLFLKFVSVPFKLAAWAVAAPLRLAARNPKAALAIATVGLIGGAAAKNKYDNDEDFRAQVDEKYAGAKNFTTEQWNNALRELGTIRNALRGDQDTIIDNVRDEAGQVRDAITGQFNEMVGEQQPSSSIPFIGQKGQTGDSFIEQYLQKNTEFQGETVDAISELGASLNESFKLNESIVEGLNSVGLSADSPILPERSLGGLVKSFSKGGGYIKGPKSGYPVSLDGGKSASFIGHGTEYVSNKSDGSSFVIPIDTPHTDRNPNLQIKRTQEALSQGYGLKGMSIGGSWRTPASELAQLRGNAAINSIAQSTNASRILSGSSSNPIVNQIAKDSLNRSAFGSIFGGTASSRPISPIPGGLGKQSLVAPTPYTPPLGGPTVPYTPPLGGPTVPYTPPLSGPTVPYTPPLGGPRKQQKGNIFTDLWSSLTGANRRNATTSTSQITPRQRMLQQRYDAIRRSGDKRAIYDFQRRYGGRTPGIPTNKDGKGNSWGYKFGRMLEDEFYDERWYGGGDGGTNIPDLPQILKPFLQGRSKGGGYKPKMHGPQIRMQPGAHELQHAPRGGWVTGPMSGYPVSVKGKNRPDFIAHGTEYIAKKPTGEYSVLPYHGKGGEMEKLSRLGAGMAGFKVPSRGPRDADFRSPSSEISNIFPGKPGFFLGGLLKGAGNLISGAAKGIGNLFGGGGGGGGDLPFAPAPSFDLNVGNIFGDQSNSGGFDLGNVWDIATNAFGGGGQEENPWAKLNPLTQASISQGQKWGFQYNDDGTIKGGSVLPGIFRQAGGLGKEIGAMFGNEELGSGIGNTIFKIFGGGGSNEDGSASFNDILSSAAGLAGQLFKDKKGLLGDVGNYANIFFGPGADRFTFGEKVALAVQHGLHGSKYSKYVRPIAQALGVDINSSVAWARELNGEGLAGPNSNAAQAASEIGPSGPNSATPGGNFDDEVGMEGGGLKAAIKSGKGILTKGFSVFNHPYFRNNKWSEFGSNQGIGFAQGGGEKAVGQRHAMGLALNVGDFRETGRLSRLTSLANNLYSRKQDEKLVNVTYDNWGSWMLGEEREGPGKFGFPDTLHLGYAKESKGSAGSSLGPVQGGLTEAQAAATAQTVGSNVPSDSSVAETAAAVNAITNEAQRSGGDLGGILQNYGFNENSFFNDWNSDKLSEMYDLSNSAGNLENVFGTDLGFNFSDTMQMATDPNTLFGSLVAEGKPEGEAENMVNAFSFMKDGNGLNFQSDSLSGYEPGLKLDFGLGSTGSSPVNHFTTDTLDLVGRNVYDRVDSGGAAENYGKSDGPNQFPFFAPKSKTPQESSQGQQGPATGGIGDVAPIPNNPAGAQEAQEGVGPDMKGNNVSQKQTELSQNAEKTGAFRHATAERSFAQSKVTEQGSQMVRGAIARVEGINADVKAAVADAQARVAQMQQASGSQSGTGSSQQAGNIGLLAQMGRFLGPG